MTRIVVLPVAPTRPMLDEVSEYPVALTASQMAAHYAAGVVDPLGDPQDNLGWEEVYGSDYPYTPGDVPVLANGLCRVRWLAAYSAFAIDVNIGGLGYQEQGRVVLYSDESGNVLTAHGNVSSAVLVEWSPERAVVRLTTSTIVSGQRVRMDTFITLQRGWTGPRFECYPAAKADGTPRGAQIRYTSYWDPATYDSALWAGGAQLASVFAVSDDPTFVDGAGLLTFASGYEPWVAMVGDLPVSVYGAVQRYGVVSRIYNDTAAYNVARKAFGVSAEQTATAVRGYVSLHLGFGSIGRLFEAESYMNPAGTRTSVADAAASGGNAINDTQTTAAANSILLNSTALGLPLGKYGIWGRVRVTTAGDTVTVGAGFFNGTGNTSGSQGTTTSSTYVWVPIGEATFATPAAPGTNDFFAYVYRSAGVGTTGVRLDRLAFVPTEKRQTAALDYLGARDHGLAHLYDSRTVPELVAR